MEELVHNLGYLELKHVGSIRGDVSSFDHVLQPLALLTLASLLLLSLEVRHELAG